MLTYKEYPDREAWLKGRQNTIGASEVAIPCGYGFKSQLELWKEKTGRKPPDDLSGNERVVYGTKAEEHLRALFALKHIHDFDVEYHEFRVYTNSDIPFLSCTLDGELIDKQTGERGIYECKTALINSKRDYEAWQNEQIPQHYYCQLLGQNAVTKYSFAILNAELRYPDGKSEIIERRVDFSDEQCEVDTKFVVDSCYDFWKNVVNDTAPATMLKL